MLSNTFSIIEFQVCHSSFLVAWMPVALLAPGKKVWRQFVPLFTSTGESLTRTALQNLFHVRWSPRGSNRREAEEDTMFLWGWRLMAIQDTVPPLGFPEPLHVEFYDQEEGIRRLPFASTCSLALHLPRGLQEDFKELINLALRGSLGFGKI